MQHEGDDHGAVGTPETDAPTPPERAFVRTAGFFFQSIGFLLSLSSCCVWSAAYWWQDALPAGTTREQLSHAFGAASAAQIWATIAVVTSFLAGLALLVLGLGLQHDRLRRGAAVMIVTVIPAAFYWAYVVAAAVHFPTGARLALGGAMAIVWTGCFLLAGAAAEQLKKAPPMPTESAWTSRDEDALRKTTSPRSPDKTSL